MRSLNNNVQDCGPEKHVSFMVFSVASLIGKSTFARKAQWPLSSMYFC